MRYPLCKIRFNHSAYISSRHLVRTTKTRINFGNKNNARLLLFLPDVSEVLLPSEKPSAPLSRLRQFVIFHYRQTADIVCTMVALWVSKYLSGSTLSVFTTAFFMQGKVLEMSQSNLPSTSKTSKPSWSLSTRQLALVMVIGGACFLSAVWAYGSQAFGLVPLDLWSICTTSEVKTIAPSTSAWEQSLTISADKAKNLSK